jgi:hypothetical protein
MVDQAFHVQECDGSGDSTFCVWAVEEGIDAMYQPSITHGLEIHHVEAYLLLGEGEDTVIDSGAG